MDKLYVKWKGYNNSFNRWIFSKPKSLGANVKIELDLSNVVIKNIEDKIPNITNLATNTTFKNKIKY